MNVTLVDNTDFVLRKVADNCQEAMQEVADMLVEAVQEKILYGYHDYHGNPPHTEIVDTGALFDSIQAEVTRASQNTFETSVGTNLSYARYPHDGTRYLKGRPFVSDGVMESIEEIQDILSGKIPQGIQ